MDLTPPQWEKVKSLFEGALDEVPADRASYLAANESDTQVRLEVERLLEHHTESGGFLSNRAFALSPSNRAMELSQSFATGEVVASRFRILRFLARGGMGEVYEAEDLELREHVALKSIRGELLHDEKSLERFKREVHLARHVTHPNVCRIYELFWHSPAQGKDAVVFVVMELLQGETLADLLKRDTRLRSADTLQMALQMAMGLGAAHSAGIVHRDFKPGNVHIVRREQGVRVVITDFGLALRSSKDAAAGLTVTGTGEVLGTPAYMSPEQVEGKELTPASDVYSLGLVLYQMVTGVRPFEAANPLSMAVSRLREDPELPRKLAPDLDRRMESLILKCLSRDARARFQNGDEVAGALSGNSQKLHPLKSARRMALEIVAVAIVTISIIVLLPRFRKKAFVLPNPETVVQPVAMRRSVAVLPFRNLSGGADKQWVATALPEMLTSELAAGGRLRTIPGENVTRASADLKLAGMQTLARDTLAVLHKYLGSDYVVIGSYLELGSRQQAQIRIDLWLQDTQTGEIAASVSEKGAESELDTLATRAGTELRQKLGVGEMTAGEAALVRASLPADTKSIRLYSEGLTKLRVADLNAAKDLLESAVASDPKFALGHSALADVWAAKGFDQKAQEESKKARDLSSGLSREERLWIEGRDWELNRKWQKAVDIYRSLVQFFPDNIEYGLRLANAQRRARTVDEALTTLASLRKLPAPDSLDPRIDIVQAEVLDVKGAYKEELTAAQAAEARARALSATQLMARALAREASSLEKQGRLDDALRFAKESARISETAGERTEVASALSLSGIVYFDQGNFVDAVKAYNDALAIQREIGNVRGTATTLNDLANAFGQQGDLSSSIRMLNQALTMFREVGDKSSAAAVLGNIAARTIQEGDLRQGKKMLEEGLTVSREVGDQERTSTFLYNLGEVLRWQGDLSGARKMYQRAQDLSNQIGDQSGVAYALFSLGDVATAEGDLPTARAMYGASMALRTKMGEKGNLAETQMALAFLQIEEGHASEAAKTLSEVREEFRKEGLGDDETLADTLLARILLAQGKLADAERETAGAHKLLGQSQDFSVRLRAAIGEARVQAAAGKTSEATRSLEETVATAKRQGYLEYQLESELAVAEIEIESGKAAAGSAMLKEVRTQAELKGFGSIAKRATRSL